MADTNHFQTGLYKTKLIMSCAQSLLLLRITINSIIGNDHLHHKPL